MAGDKERRLYEIFLVLCIAIMLSCDSLAFHVVEINGNTLSTSGVIFPIDFLLLAIVTNSYGYRASGRIVWYMMLAQFLFVGTINFFSIFGHIIENETQNAYYTLYSRFIKLLISSTIAVLTSYFINDFFISYLKAKTRFLAQQTVIRILIGASISQGILVIVSYSINFYGIYAYNKILTIAMNTWVYKMICVFCLIPFITIITFLIKKIIKIDKIDTGISYNPFLVFRE